MIGMSEYPSTSEVIPSNGVSVYESNKHFEYSIIYNWLLGKVSKAVTSYEVEIKNITDYI
jgi:hypothetical protein